MSITPITDIHHNLIFYALTEYMLLRNSGVSSGVIKDILILDQVYLAKTTFKLDWDIEWNYRDISQFPKPKVNTIATTIVVV